MKTKNLKTKALKILQYFSLTVFILYTLIWMLSPTAINYYLADYLENNFQLELSENTSIRYNPFMAHLTIENLSMSKADQQVFKINELNAEIRLHRLIANQLYVSEISMNGLFVSLEQQNKQLTIAGVNLNDLQSSPAETPAVIEKKDDESSFEIIIPKLRFLDEKIDFSLNGDSHQLKFEQIDIKKVIFSKQKQKLQLNLRAFIDNAPVKLDVKVELEEFLGDIDSSLSITQFDLNNLKKQAPESIQTLNGLFDFKLNSTVQITSDQIKLLLPKLSIDFNEFLIKTDEVDLQQQQQNITLNDVNITTQLHDFSSDFQIAHFEISGKNFSVKRPQSQFENAHQEFSINNIQGSYSKDDTVSTTFKSLELSLMDLKASQGHLLAAVQEFKFKLDAFNMNKDQQSSVVTSRGNLVINDISSYVKDQDNLLVKISSINIDNIEVSTSPLLNVSFSELKIHKSEFSNRVNQPKVPGLVSFDSFSLAKLEFKDNLIAINKMVVDGLNANLHIGPEKGIKNLIPYELLILEKEIVKDELDAVRENEVAENIASVVENSNAEDSNSETGSTVPLIKLDLFELTNVKQFSFTDESVKPIYERKFFIETLFVKQIDSTQPNQESPFQFKGKSDQYTKFDFKGYLKPFTEELNLNIDGVLTEVSLPKTSSYIKNLLGFKFESGELDTDLDIVITNSEISGSTEIVIRGLNLSATEKYDQTTLEQQTALPLNVALDMLKDGSGNVELDIPMTGNVNSPTFGFGSFIALITKKAIQSAAQSYLIKTFIPYAEIVTMTISAGDFILKTRFEDLAYSPDNTELVDEQLVYVDQFIALMKDKDSTQVKVCAISTMQDLAILETPPEGDEAVRIFLNSQSNKRMIYFKEYVVKQGIESARVLLCIPKAELNAEKASRIEISV